MTKFADFLLSAATMVFASSYAFAVDLVWSDPATGQLLRGPADGSSQPQILFAKADYPGSPLHVAPFGLAIDTNYIYWSDTTTHQILRGALDGSGSATLLFDASDYPALPANISPAGLAVDDDYIYWADNATGSILRGAVDGSGAATAIFGMGDYPSTPSDVYPWDVSVGGGSIYWTDSDTAQVLRGSVDGSGSVEVMFGSDPDLANLGLAIDESHIYWTDVENILLTGGILRGQLDGSGDAEILYENGDYPGSPISNVPVSVATGDGHIYWVDNLTHQILQGSTDGSGAATLVYDIANYPGSPTSIQPAFLELISDTYDADYDADGDVDGRDFLLWQRGGSPSALSTDDLALWQTQYGTSTPLLTLIAVPEPSAIALSLIALCSVSRGSPLRFTVLPEGP